MTDAVKLLTQAEVADIFVRPYSEIEQVIAELRERGLIAPEPEPVDPIRQLAEEIDEEWGAGGDRVAVVVERVLRKRGMEMRAPLTREMVREALRQCRWSDDDHYVDRFIAALTKEQS